MIGDEPIRVFDRPLCVLGTHRLWTDRRSLGTALFLKEQMTLFLVRTEEKMGGGGANPAQSCQFLRDESCKILKISPAHDNQKIVGTRHQIARLHLIEAAHPHCDSVESAFALRTDLQLDNGRYLVLVDSVGIENRNPAEQGAIFPQSLQFALDLLVWDAQNLRHLGSRETFAA